MSVNSFLEDALRESGVVHHAQAASGGQIAQSLRILNKMLGRWMGDGIPINDGTLTDGDEFPLDMTEEDIISQNLQVRLRRKYRRPRDLDLIQEAEDGYRWLKAKYDQVQEAHLDSALTSTGRRYNINSDSNG